ncbi:hypothetical protein LTR70_004384 [Exophiala xenobiotica]|uniref:Uncharacterized protein n=1 Tax=Lithohypha guttulata TaxID=1690604 RepID=A0ABR0KJA5_9EURO|nr:hypothetical protein LTR24_001961 [Lithohypha guttulata]KAK5320974.1 hypothetical protein LTR70_004384 [Exophiala xenobiotica]
MSADLLAAFGNADVSVEASQGKDTSTVSEVSPQPNHEDTWQPWPTQSEQRQARLQAVDEDDVLWKQDERGTNVLFDADDTADGQGSHVEVTDDFGDFENAEADDSPAMVQPSFLPPDTGNKQGNLLDLDDYDRTAAITKPSSVDNGRERPGASFTVTGHGDVKSLATLVDESNDWGNFEGAGSASNAAPKIMPVEQPPSLPVGQLAMSRSKPVPKSQPPKQGIPRSAAVPHISTITDDELDVWDDFEDGNANLQTLAASGAGIAEQGITVRLAGTRPGRRERPTNVPPPAVLLSLVSKVWPVLASQARQSQDVKDIAMTALRTYRVSARIISGRSQRWKRDIILAQSMRIGAAGRSGGMKLTALDRGESRKEDQEAEEVIASWTQVSHVLNAAMAKAKIQKPPTSLSTKLVVRIATGPDVLNANHVCPICGLRRNERVNGIDVDVSDTFGEFWFEHWGHSDCCVWWEQYNQLLQQR